MSDNFLYAFGVIENAMGGGGDVGQSFPASDVQDLADGADYIPGEVTIARRAGRTVSYNRVAKAWTLPDGTVIK